MHVYFLAMFIFGVVASIVAYDKGRNSLGWFVAGILIGPFSLIVAALPRVAREGRFIRCHQCTGVIQEAAETCRFCGTQNLDAARRPGWREEAEEAP